jgi:hypothetical protein
LDGDHTVDSSGGGHIDEDIYGVSDGDQEVRRLPKETTEFQDQDQDQDQDQGQGSLDNPDYQDSLVEEDINQLAAHLGKQSLNSQGSPRKSPRKSRRKSRTAKSADLVGNSVADSAASQLEVASQLAEQFYSFHSCTDDAHDACNAEYTQSLALYTTIAEILRFQELGTLVPDALSALDFLESPEIDEAALLQQLYKGWRPPIETGDKLELPKKLYLPHKASKHQNQQPKTTYDIDGLCLFPTSLAVAQQGLY